MPNKSHTSEIAWAVVIDVISTLIIAGCSFVWNKMKWDLLCLNIIFFCNNYYSDISMGYLYNLAKKIA